MDKAQWRPFAIPYITAWLKYILEGDQFARGAFVGTPSELEADADWDWQADKNLP